jgi:hypothetical protein
MPKRKALSSAFLNSPNPIWARLSLKQFNSH